ncbi:MAG: hypothetical protein JWR67_1803 [Mucilaginibacter sp.]|nr:hypothetical protein [Mucilaginibacter sp.]
MLGTIKGRKIEIDGIVKNKFIEANNHNSNAITIVSNKETINIHFSANEDYELWEKIEINSHIKKGKNSLIYYLENNSKMDTIVVNTIATVFTTSNRQINNTCSFVGCIHG